MHHELTHVLAIERQRSLIASAERASHRRDTAQQAHWPRMSISAHSAGIGVSLRLSGPRLRRTIALIKPS